MPSQFEQFDFSKEPDRDKFGKLDKDEQEKIAQASEDEAYLMDDEFKKDEKEKESEIETVEKELSPEVIEMIMQKVQNINKEGTAYSVVAEAGSIRELLRDRKERDDFAVSQLKSTLLFGIQGGATNKQTKEIVVAKTKDGYKKRRENNKPNNVVVHFNIVGRVHDSRGEFSKESHEIKNSMYVRSGESITILFDINRFKEQEPLKDNLRYISQKDPHNIPKLGHYVTNDPNIIKVWKKEKKKNPDLKIGDIKIREVNRFNLGKWIFDEKEKKHKIVNFDDKGLSIPSDEYGFVLYPRVAPRFFKGIVLNIEDLEYLNKPPENWDNKTRKNFKKWLMDRLDYLANRISSVMLEAGRDKNKLLPIYCSDGSLLWPKQMSYEEVKKFVEERDKKKEEIKEKE